MKQKLLIRNKTQPETFKGSSKKGKVSFLKSENFKLVVSSFVNVQE